MSQIVAPSLIVPLPLFFQPRSMLWYAQNSYFIILKQHNFISRTPNMQFYTIICCFLWYQPYLYPIYEFKFNILVFLIMVPPQKLVLAPGPQFETIWYIYLICICIKTFNYDPNSITQHIPVTNRCKHLLNISTQTILIKLNLHRCVSVFGVEWFMLFN